LGELAAFALGAAASDEGGGKYGDSIPIFRLVF